MTFPEEITGLIAFDAVAILVGSMVKILSMKLGEIKVGDRVKYKGSFIKEQKGSLKKYFSEIRGTVMSVTECGDGKTFCILNLGSTHRSSGKVPIEHLVRCISQLQSNVNALYNFEKM